MKMKSTGQRTRKCSREQGGLKITKIGSTKEEVIIGKKSGNQRKVKVKKMRDSEGVYKVLGKAIERKRVQTLKEK